LDLDVIISGIEVIKIIGGTHRSVLGISHDSRTVREGDIFICRGVAGDGHRYSEDAYDKGARIFIIEKELDKYHDDAVYIFCSDTKGALSLVSRAFYDFPEKKMYMIGVTGTKGKTTTAYFIKAIFDACGTGCGMIGTIYNIIGNEKHTAERTTPEGLEIQKMLAQMADSGAGAAVMEVSSHALMTGRVKGMNFNIGIFTNLSQDHLDFHGDMEGYFRAKMQLFEQSDKCIINIDDPYGKKAADELSAKNRDVFSISLKDENADLFGHDISYDTGSASFRIKGLGNCLFRIGMYGIYNVYNALTAIAAAYIYGIDPACMQDSLKDVTVPGRQEKYMNPPGHRVIIDYAHSPGSLKETLESFRAVIGKGRLIVLFGAGGDRDRTKRPQMGRIAGELADIVIITSDNPRTEKPEDIIRDIEEGIKNVEGAVYSVICDRTEAIKYAVRLAGRDDIIILAGKGHETYQEIDHVKYHLDEREILDRIYEEIK
jgi:UDP-N-acetylmuramoyl-L-alanyl-D-glutamate--2,6-diaminopimelate ligase